MTQYPKLRFLQTSLNGGETVDELQTRRVFSHERIDEIRSKLSDSEKRVEGKACVYVTGSFGRGEASGHSDLDLFIVGKNTLDDVSGIKKIKRPKSQLRRLDEICVKADLIEVSRELEIQEFSGDGDYLIHYSIGELINTLGGRDDDATNTFTARLLLLLESQFLLERTVYEEIIEEVISAYWRDYEDHKENFIPAFLTNDILRLWRTFCVNYEAGTDKEPVEKKIKRKLKNYKLKHSRMLTCYSAILYLLNEYRKSGVVSPDSAVEMTKLTPTGRLEFLLGDDELAEARPAIKDLLSRYGKFLEATNAPEAELLERFGNHDANKKYLDEAYSFGDSVAKTLQLIGKGSAERFYRLLIV
jgi:predicted nucleotidyltransferase